MITRRLPFSRFLLLVAAALAGWAALARADPVVGKWNEVVRQGMVQKRIGERMGRAPLPPLANMLCAGRIMSMLHVAQWKGVNEVLKANNITSMEEAKARLPALQADLQAAVAGAGQAVLATALPELTDQWQALFSAQAGDAAGQQAAAVALGTAAGKEVLALRATDGANATGPDYMGSNDTGMWRPTPPLFKPGGGVAWRKVTPWVLDNPEQLRPATPPALKSPEYKKSYLEVMSVGNLTSPGRTKEHTEEIFLWNEFPDVLLFQTVDQVTRDSDLLDAARTYALTSAAGVDARVTSMEAKYFYSTWRPITAIPAGNGMDYPADAAFATVIPTPPTPEFPSGHAIHAEAILEILRRTRGGGATAGTKAAAQAADGVDLTLTSPVPLPVVKQQPPLQQRALQQAPGAPAGQQGEMAPVTRSYKSLTELSEQLAVSRINGGLHYRFTVDTSVKVGQAVANKVWGDFDRKYTAINVSNKVQEEEREQGQGRRRRRALRAA